MNLAGKVSISRSSGAEGEAIRITVIDQGSDTEFVCAQLSLADFGAAVTGLGHRPALLEVRGLDRVGRLRECKREYVSYTGPGWKPGRLAPVEALEALAPFEVNGWTGRVDDLFNGYKQSVPGTFEVSFERWVPRPDSAEVAP